MTVPLKLQVKIIYALAVELTVVTLADEDTSNNSSNGLTMLWCPSHLRHETWSFFLEIWRNQHHHEARSGVQRGVEGSECSQEKLRAKVGKLGNRSKTIICVHQTTPLIGSRENPIVRSLLMSSVVKCAGDQRALFSSSQFLWTSPKTPIVANQNRFSPSNWLQLEWNVEISLEAKFFFYAMDENWYCDIATYYVVLHWYSIEYRWIWLGNWQNTGAGPGKIVKNWVSLGAKHMMTFVMVDGHCWDSIFQNINFYELFFVENYFAGLKW